MANMKVTPIDAALFVLASPILFVQALGRARERYRFFRLATEAQLICECGAAISLVGMWRCACGFVYRGHLLRMCQVCGSIPCVVRCYRCGVTTKLPESS
jgi:hypothetical protein